MNIFVIDLCPKKAAQALGDRHVVKMILETAQIMCSAFPAGEAPYTRTHYNHPCCVWARKSSENYEWLYLHGIALGCEKTRRFGGGHKSIDVIKWCWSNVREARIEVGERTPFAQAMPEVYRNKNDVVGAYRAYYLAEKKHLHKWTNREKPEWI